MNESTHCGSIHNRNEFDSERMKEIMSNPNNTPIHFTACSFGQLAINFNEINPDDFNDLPGETEEPEEETKENLNEVPESRVRLFYVAGPYTNEDSLKVRENIRIATNVGMELMRMGHMPFIPHVMGSALEARAREKGIDFDYEFMMKYCVYWLNQCDSFYFIGHSPGTDRELNIAKHIQLDIYENLNSVPPAFGFKNELAEVAHG